MLRILSSGRARLIVGAAFVAAFLNLAGCSGSGPKIVPVSGTVTIDGQPLTYGHVQILPAGWRPASGRLDGSGRFVLTTTSPNDGCAVGTHPVVILSGESLSPEIMKWHAPQKYADVKTSELTVTITGPTDDLKIELISDGSMKPGKSPPKEGGSEFTK
jgi:hypothetical protein